MATIDDLNLQRFYHGKKADLKPGDLIEPGYKSNYGKRKKAFYLYLTATLDAATWGLSLPSAKNLAESTLWNQQDQLRVFEQKLPLFKGAED